MLLPLTAQITTGARSWRRLVTYEGILKEKSSGDGILELSASWQEFKPMWRGEDVRAPQLDSQEIEKTYRIGLSTYESHQAGEFEVKLLNIVAFSGTDHNVD